MTFYRNIKRLPWSGFRPWTCPPWAALDQGWHRTDYRSFLKNILRYLVFIDRPVIVGLAVGVPESGACQDLLDCRLYAGAVPDQ